MGRSVLVLNQLAGGGATAAALTLCEDLRLRGTTVAYLPVEGVAEEEAVRDAIENARPDLVHAHCWYGTWRYGLMRDVARRVPTVITLHDPFMVNQYGIECWECYRNGLCLGCPALSAARRWRPNYRIKDRLAKWWQNRGLRAHLVFPSEWMRRRVARSELRGLPGSVLPYGIDTAFWHPGESEDGGQVLSVLFAGHMYAKGDDRKGLHFLLEAWPQVRRALPEAELRLAGRLFGSALPEGCRHLGELDRSAMRDALRSASVFCLPTLGDNSPLAVLEAMSCGRPVVATEVGGIPEQLAGGEAGVLVPPRDAAALARALIETLRDPASRRRLGREARERVVSHFGREGSAEQHLALYERVLADCGPRF